jgi:hypothetical protein
MWETFLCNYSTSFFIFILNAFLCPMRFQQNTHKRNFLLYRHGAGVAAAQLFKNFPSSKKPKVHFDYGWNLSWDRIILYMLTHHISLRFILTLPKSQSIFLMTFPPEISRHFCCNSCWFCVPSTESSLIWSFEYYLAKIECYKDLYHLYMRNFFLLLRLNFRGSVAQNSVVWGSKFCTVRKCSYDCNFMF